MTPADLVPRPALAARLAGALDDGAMELVAPAGYGKSVALQQALERRGGDAAWVRCTPADRDPGRLLIHLLEVMRGAVPGLGAVLGDRLAAAERVDVAAAVSAEVRAVAGPPEIVASGSAAGTTQRTFGAEQSAWSAVNGHSSVFMRFTVVGAAVPYAASGTLSTGAPSDGNGSFILYRTSGGFLQIERFENQAFNVSGTLPPGTYEMGSGASCSSDQPVSCTASFDLSFDIDP